ncbi:MAG TPA: hypothetical protein VJ987_09260 [Anaerolineales bacterium]|nr:hypothetical protein [Anaerolineales bacterium]
MRILYVTFSITGLLFITSCLPSTSIPPTETTLPSDTPSPTPTIIWFPPSATPTLKALPTNTALPDMSPGIGSVILNDDFPDDSAWDTAVSDQGTAAISRNRLTLAAQPGIYLVSMNREAVLGDFYAEITAHPSLCRGDDSYGIIIRSQGNSFYRFTLTCNSMISMERIKNSVRLFMQDPTPSGDAPPGAPGEVRIGIWAIGSEMRFFLNGRFQFNITDPSMPSGAFGVFARAEGDTPLSVIFSDFIVYNVNYVPPTNTPLP